MARSMALDLILDSLTRSVSEGILGENKQPKPLADASGYKVSAIGRTLLRVPSPDQPEKYDRNQSWRCGTQKQKYRMNAIIAKRFR